MTRTTIWYETAIEPYKNKYICQIFEDDGKFKTLVVADSYKEAVDKANEIMYGKEE